ncbi:MAG: efflux RND transporter periplasmic adaptor subunit [Acidobacteriota bacterium]
MIRIRSWKSAALAAAVVCAMLAGVIEFWRGPDGDPSLVATVERGDLTATLVAGGTLRPVRSRTYRSPVIGRELEILALAAEGTHVDAGALLVRLDTTDLERDRDRVRQELGQAQLDLQVAEGEWDEARAEIQSVTDGEGALTVEEARARLQSTVKKRDRLREEYNQLEPLLARGFMTREELARTAEQLEQAEEDAILAKRRASVVTDLAHPREQRRAAAQLAQKQAQLGHARTRVQDANTRLRLVSELLEACTIRSVGPGLVVYEELLAANPRRKVRVGDRVLASQGLVTIPEVTRMLVEASVSEADVHRVKPGQPAVVRVEAFPDLRLAGAVSRVGTLASSSVARPFEEKRFDLVIELDPSTADLRPEMTARADVVLGTRPDVLLVPVTAVFERAGTFVTYVVGARGLESRVVQLGASNDRMVEVVAGLSEHDRVSLVEPAAGSDTVAAPPTPASPVRSPTAEHASPPR